MTKGSVTKDGWVILSSREAGEFGQAQMEAWRYHIVRAMDDVVAYAEVMAAMPDIAIIDTLNMFDEISTAAQRSIEMFVPVELEDDFYRSTASIRAVVHAEATKRALPVVARSRPHVRH